jgi:hypothetical protein
MHFATGGISRLFLHPSTKLRQKSIEFFQMLVLNLFSNEMNKIKAGNAIHRALLSLLATCCVVSVSSSVEPFPGFSRLSVTAFAWSNSSISFKFGRPTPVVSSADFVSSAAQLRFVHTSCYHNECSLTFHEDENPAPDPSTFANQRELYTLIVLSLVI